MFFKDFVSVKRKKIKKGASQTYDTPSCAKAVIVLMTANKSVKNFFILVVFYVDKYKSLRSFI